eukprot:3404531-Pleurochrysis_carterae.AAC.5
MPAPNPVPTRRHHRRKKRTKASSSSTSYPPMNKRPQPRRDQDPDDEFESFLGRPRVEGDHSTGTRGAGGAMRGGMGGEGGEGSEKGRGRCAVGLKCCILSEQRPTGYARVRRGRMRQSTPPWITAKAWLMACGDNSESNMTLSVSLLWIQTEEFPQKGGMVSPVASWQYQSSQTTAQEYAPHSQETDVFYDASSNPLTAITPATLLKN